MSSQRFFWPHSAVLYAHRGELSREASHSALRRCTLPLVMYAFRDHERDRYTGTHNAALDVTGQEPVMNVLVNDPAAASSSIPGSSRSANQSRQRIPTTEGLSSVS